MIAANEAQAREFERHMCQVFHARVIRKEDAVEMQIAAAVFDVLRSLGKAVPPSQEFLTRYATTLGPFIYLPDGLSPDERIETIAHECQHVVQFFGRSHTGLSSGPGFAWLYITQGEARVRYEVEAYRAGLEVIHARSGLLPALDSLAFPLTQGYSLNDGEIVLARDLLEQAATTVVKLGPSTEAGIEAVKWLRQMGLASK